MNGTNNDVRWKRRFSNFEKAYLLLERAMDIAELSKVERAGLIQFFEMAFELAWKLMKDYLEEEGFTVKTPRDAIKQALQADIIKDGHNWMDALNDRNLTTHTYEEETAIEVAKKIKEDYAVLLKELYLYFKDKMKA
jgi:nucleotidyltransferase substrate binding protein (TIGR01987 family)